MNIYCEHQTSVIVNSSSHKYFRTLYIVSCEPRA